MTMKFSVFQLSRRGGRAKNEDRVGYCYTSAACLLVLADGMGGHPEGEVAAEIALQNMSALFQRQALPKLADPQAFLAEALLQAQHQILRYAQDRAMRDAPRTTLVAAVIQQGQLSWIHCGDSRLYLERAGALLARTRDHSYRETGQHLGQGMSLANRNLLFTCLGSPLRPIYELAGPWTLKQGDRLLLCSDGLWDSLGEAELLSILGSEPVSLCVPRLVDTALRRAGQSSDNVTALALEWEMASPLPSRISSEELEGDRFESTIQTGPLAELEDELSDAAIERSIAEINAAIRCSVERGRR
jgi:serine/threonine protein phosphatase PrpC